MAKYTATSPWFTTKVKQDYLDVLSIRTISAESDDFLYTIEAQYANRPDLLSYDLYGTPNLWWVFSQRNLDTIEDPVFDFNTGVQIYIPKKSSLFAILGL